MYRLLAAAFLFLLVTGCQTGSDTEGALESATVVKVEKTQPSAEPSDQVTVAASDTVNEEDVAQIEEKPTTPEKPKAQTDSSSTDDPVIAGVQTIAKLRKSKGERAAVETVFACYKKARARSEPISTARVCAAQDFALSRDIISRRADGASGTGDRALLISKRHAARIGALMQLKGMGQTQFNTFGKYLHAVAEPAYKKALAS